MGSDAVNAPVEERHRREAVEVYYQPEHGTAPRYVQRWVEQGHWGPISNAFLNRTAQSLANLESTIHARYAGLVEAATEAAGTLRDRSEYELAERIQQELEKLNDGK